MKRVLLSLMLLYSAFKVHSQAVLNEIYFNPTSTEKEYLEFYNSGSFDNLDYYTFLALYDDGVTSGFYVVNFPNAPINSNSYVVLSAGLPFNHQGGGYNGTSSDFSWNSLNVPMGTGYFKQYKRVNNTYEEILPPINSNNILTTLPSSYGTKYAVLLYRNGFLVNSLSINGTDGAVPTGLLNMPPLNVPSDGVNSGFTATFSTILGSQFEYMQPAIGQSNGAYRTSDGRCGTWQKASRSTDNTPGKSNGPSAVTDNTIISVGGSVSCTFNQNNKRTADYFVVNNQTSANAYPLTLQLYEDNGSSPGQLDANDLFLEQQTILTAPAQSSPNTVYTKELQNNNANILVVAKATSGCFQTIQGFSNSCSPLPVTFSNFHAQRNRDKVALKWETLSEQNNRGFNVQRNTRGVWETIAFIFSAADGGNSATKLSYEFNDANSEKGVSQYRIQQVDLDGKASYSPIRSVKGLEQAATRTVVYPNPSSDGKVSVVFEDQGAKAVVVSDLSGRVIRQYRNVLNNVQIEGLESGMYSIQVTDLSTATSVTEKVIIKKR